MPLPDQREDRPQAHHPEAGHIISTAIKIPSKPTATDDALADLDARAERLRGRFVVQTEVDGEHYRTHVHLTAKSAENAVRRANARGKRVHVTMCQLLPVGVVVGLGGVT